MVWIDTDLYTSAPSCKCLSAISDSISASISAISAIWYIPLKIITNCRVRLRPGADPGVAGTDTHYMTPVQLIPPGGNISRKYTKTSLKQKIAETSSLRTDLMRAITHILCFRQCIAMVMSPSVSKLTLSLRLSLPPGFHRARFCG